MSWPMVTLGELVSIKGGGTPSKSDSSFWEGNIPWASVKDLKGSEISVTEDSISELGVKNSATNIIPAGTIITATRMALGKFAINTIDMAINQDLKALLVKDTNKVSRDYLFRFLESRAQFIQAEGKGATVKGITLDFLKSIEVPLPPLAEQKRIAAILDKADAIRRKRQQAIQLADDFLRAVFLQMFVSNANKNEWGSVKFAQVIKIDAPMVDPQNPEYIDLIHIGPDRIEKNTGKFLPALTAREENLISKKFLFDSTYVLYSKIRPYLKKVAIPNFTGLCSADMYPVKPMDGLLTREYLWQLLLSDEFTRYTETLPDRASIPKLNRDELINFEFPLPPIELQQKFSGIVLRYKGLTSNHEFAMSALTESFDALSKKAFSGQL